MANYIFFGLFTYPCFQVYAFARAVKQINTARQYITIGNKGIFVEQKNQKY